MQRQGDAIKLHGIIGCLYAYQAVAGSMSLGPPSRGLCRGPATGQELTGSIREQQEHLITWLELSWLSWPAVGPLLFLLCCFHVFPNDGGGRVDPLLHLLYRIDQGPEQRGLFFPGFSGHIQQSSRLLPKEKLEEDEPGGCLRHLPDAKSM